MSLSSYDFLCGSLPPFIPPFLYSCFTESPPTTRKHELHRKVAHKCPLKYCDRWLRHAEREIRESRKQDAPGSVTGCLVASARVEKDVKSPSGSPRACGRRAFLNGPSNCEIFGPILGPPNRTKPNWMAILETSMVGPGLDDVILGGSLGQRGLGPAQWLTRTDTT